MNPADIFSLIGVQVLHAFGWVMGSSSHYVTAVFQSFVVGTGNPDRPGTAFITSPTIQRFEPVCQVAADAGLVAALTWGSYRAMWTSSVRSRETARYILPRVVLAVVLINFSGTLFQAAVEVNNALCRTVTQNGIAFDWASGLAPGDLGGTPLNLLVTAALMVGYLLLAFAYVVRYALLVVLAITAPLAALLFVLPDTHRYAKEWGHLLVPTLFMQPLQLLVLGLGFSLNATASGLPGHVFALASLFLAFKVPGALSAASSTGTHATSEGKRWAKHLVHAAVKAF